MAFYNNVWSLFIVNEDKFIDSIEIDEWEIESDTGWESITHIHKTIRFLAYEISTTNFSLKCADKHIIIGENCNQVYAKDLVIGDLVKTKNGLEPIVNVRKLEQYEHMYDVTVESKDHTFYSDGILSHNTTISTIYLLWYIIFNEDKLLAVLANKEITAIEILRKIKFGYMGLPLWLQQGIADDGWAEKKIVTESNVRCVAYSTASSAIRGFTINILFCDEFAWVPKNVADDFMSSVYPTISTGKSSQMIICSTPNGLNSYYHIYNEAVKGKNGFRPVRISWNEVPGCDENWKRDIIRDIGIVKWNQEFAARFIGSSKTLVDPDVLEILGTNIIDPIDLKLGDFLHVYERPEDRKFYILGVDTAKGVGGDYSTIQVLKVNTEYDIEQVAIYRNNTIDTYAFAQVCIVVSEYYNHAYMMIENNDVGGEVTSTIWHEFEYDYVLNFEKVGLGIRSNRRTKLSACLFLKRYIENGWLLLHDKTTIYELTMFEEVSPDVFKAQVGDTDDTVMSLAWGVYFLTTTFFDGKNLSVKQIDDKFLVNKEDEDSPVMLTSDQPELDEYGFDWSNGGYMEGDYL